MQVISCVGLNWTAVAVAARCQSAPQSDDNRDIINAPSVTRAPTPAGALPVCIPTRFIRVHWSRLRKTLAGNADTSLLLGGIVVLPCWKWLRMSGYVDVINMMPHARTRD